MTVNVKTFIRDETGAVTIDWLPITAAVVFLGAVVAMQTGVGSVRLGGNVSDAAGGIDMAELASRNSGPLPDQPSAPGNGGDFNDLPPYVPPTSGGGGAADFVPGNGNSCGGQGSSCSGLGDGTNPGQGSGNNNAGNTPGGTGTDNPNNSGNNSGDGAQSDPSGGSSSSGSGGGTGGSGTGGAAAPLDVDYVFPDLIIDHNGWATTAVSQWVDLANILPHAMQYTVTGPGNPTAQAVNGQQHQSHNVRWGTNIRMEVPPAGESYTAILNVGNGFWTAAFTVVRLHDPAAMPGEGAGGNTPGLPTNPDFVIPTTTIHPHYTGHVYSQWMGANDLPFALPANFEMSGEGNGTLQTANGHATSGQIPSWGTQFRADPPPCGTTGTAVITLATGEVGIWQIERPDC